MRCLKIGITGSKFFKKFLKPNGNALDHYPDDNQNTDAQKHSIDAP